MYLVFSHSEDIYVHKANSIMYNKPLIEVHLNHFGALA